MVSEELKKGRLCSVCRRLVCGVVVVSGGVKMEMGESRFDTKREKQNAS